MEYVYDDSPESTEFRHDDDTVSCKEKKYPSEPNSKPVREET